MDVFAVFAFCIVAVLCLTAIVLRVLKISRND